MRLVIDTNIIISSLISNSVRRSILMDSGFELMAPEYTFTEIMKHADLIKKKAKLTSDDLQHVMDVLFSRIAQSLTFADIPRNFYLILAEVSEIAPAARYKDQDNYQKH